VKDQMFALREILDQNGPRGVTPLSDRLQSLRRWAPHLDQWRLMAFLVIRFATDDDRKTEFYNKVDAELELPLDILDDLQGEAKEVKEAGNGWLTYTPLLHRIRESGTGIKLFDLLDERPFTVVEIATFMGFLFQKRGDPPFPWQKEQLCHAVVEALLNSPVVFDGLTGRMGPPVKLKELKRALKMNSLGSCACTLM
ncbi:unnamed protein product, partial [Polarella glacialis]